MNTRIFVWLAVVFSSIIYSQNLDPTEDKVGYNDEVAECWRVVIYPQTKEAKKAFKKFMNKRYDVSLEGFGMFSNRDVLQAEDVIVTKISSKKINFYVSIIDVDGLTEIKVFGNYGYSVFFNNEKFKEEYIGLRKILVDFVNYYLPKYHQDRVEEAKERYEDFVDEDARLNTKLRKNRERIRDLKKEIEDLERDIYENTESLKHRNEVYKETVSQYDILKSKLNKIKE